MSETAALEKVCIEANQKLVELNLTDFAELKSKLDWCLGSYSYDKNPAGLYETGAQVLSALKAYKEANPKAAITKKLLDDMAKVLEPTSSPEPKKVAVKEEPKAKAPAPKAKAEPKAEPKAKAEPKPKAEPKAKAAPKAAAPKKEAAPKAEAPKAKTAKKSAGK